MLRTDGAKWTVDSVGDAAVDLQKTRESPDFSTSASDDSDNGKSGDCPELEALRQIYEQICAIRNNHAQVLTENASKRAEVCIITLFTVPILYIRDFK